MALHDPDETPAGKRPRARSNWRGKAGGEAAPQYRWQRDWLNRPEQELAGKLLRHRVKIAVWSLLACGLIGAIIAVALFFPKKTPLIALAVTDYDAPLPPNAWSREDIERLASLDSRNLAYSDLSSEWTSEERGLRALAERLAAAKPGGPHRDVVVIYLSMHGAVNGAAEPCLLPPGAAPLASETWLPVRRLLQAIKDQRLSPRVQKLLVLDCNRMTFDWSLGLTYNGFADRLQAVVEEAGISNLWVLNSSGPGQQGWASEELQGSVFGHFLWRGLAGAADEERGNRDGRVSIRELHAYLKERVGQWVMANRLDLQEPLLIASGDAPGDMLVAWSETKLPADAANNGPNAAVQDQPNALWLRHEQLSRRDPIRFTPLAWEDFQRKLLRWEQLLTAGKAYRRQAADMQSELEGLAASLAQRSLPETMSLPGLSLSARVLESAQPAQADRERIAERLADPAVKLSLAQPPSPAGQAHVAWNWWLDQPTRDNLHRVLEFAGQIGGAEAPWLELQFLRMLDRHLDATAWTDAGPAIGRLSRLRQQAETAAAPLDERAFYGLRALADRADQARRLAEDCLFIGDRRDLEQSADQASQAERAYQACLAEAEALAEALNVRDRAWAETPYLAQWLCRGRAEQDDANSNRASWGELALLIDNHHALAASIDAVSEGRSSLEELGALRKVVAAALDKLRASYDRECYRLRFEAGDDQKSLRDLMRVLTSPLLTGERRNELRAAAARLSRLLHDRYSAVAGAAASAGKSDYRGPLNLQQLSEVVPRLADALMSQAEPAAAAPDQQGDTRASRRDDLDRIRLLCATGEKLRCWLAAIPRQSGQRLQTGFERLRNSPSSAWESRADFASADAAVRAAAALLAETRWADRESAPTLQLRKLDLHNLLAWHAQRAVDDFWGPPQAGSPPFFSLAADQCLQAASLLCKAADGQREGVIRRQKQRLAAAAQGLRPAATPDTLVVLEGGAPYVAGSVRATPAEDFPAGRAAMFFRGAAGAPLPIFVEELEAKREAPRLGVPVGPGSPESSQLNYFLGSEGLLNRGSTLQLVGLYRGHEYLALLRLVPAKGGITVVQANSRSRSAQVTVSGNARQRTSITFIFDCSGSMSTTVQQDNRKRTRLDVAREALQAILDVLANTESYRLAVRLYGHRAGWKDRFSNDVVYSDYGKKQQQAALDAGRPFHIHPSNDVELALPMGKFTERENRAVQAVLGAIEPRGETPLYLAIVEALNEDFRADADAAQRHIVVITDGVNEQSAGGPPGSIKLRRDVEQALEGHRQQPIRLDIVGFDLSANESKDKVDDLRAVARRTGGAFYSANDPSGLLQILEESLGLSKYVLEGADGSLSEPRDLGATTIVDLPASGKAICRARVVGGDPPVRSDDFVLAGDEALELFLSSDKRRLEHRRYTGGAEQNLRDSQTELSDPSQPANRFFIGAHLPEWQGSGVRFPVSVQNADETRFSPRPQMAWVEIKPLAADRRQDFPAYVFCDLDFEPRRPVPVLSCLATHWPLEATKAEIRVWCKFQSVEPDQLVPLAKILPAAREESEFKIPGLAETSFKVQIESGAAAPDGQRIVVTEIHPPDAPGLYNFKVALDPPPDSTIRTYYPQASLARHEFSYAAARGPVWTRARLQFTSRSRLLEQSVTLGKPLTVRIPDPLLRN